jgi:hypothetical protein
MESPYVAHDLTEKDQPEQGEGDEQRAHQRAVVLAQCAVPFGDNDVRQKHEIHRQGGALERGDDAL